MASIEVRNIGTKCVSAFMHKSIESLNMNSFTRFMAAVESILGLCTHEPCNSTFGH